MTTTVKLFDTNGQAIPLKGMKGVVNADRNYHYVQPTLNLPDMYRRVKKYFPGGTIFVSEEEYMKQAQALIAEIRADVQVSNLLNGCHLPIPLPQIRKGDYDTVLEEDFLPTVAKSYESVFPGREFKNWRRGDLIGKISIADKRHVQLVERLAVSPLVGLYFTNAFQGFGIEDDHQMIQKLPRRFSLSGGIDAATVYIADPITMAKDVNTPVTDCAALSWQSAEYSLCFDPDNDDLRFGRRLLAPHSHYSSGLLFVR